MGNPRDLNASAVNHSPLADKRILITRATHQASNLAHHLKELGASTISIPTIEIVPPTSLAALDEALEQIINFDIVTFTSANAVQAFGKRAGVLGVMPTPKRIAVVGPATARAVEDIGLHANTIPPVYTAEALAETLLPGARGQKMLLVLAENAPSTLESALTAGGADVHVAIAYANRIPQTSLAAMKELLAEESTMPHAVTFTSASTAAHLAALLETAGLTLPRSVARISIGPVTSRALERLGLPPHAEATEPTIEALAAAVVTQLLAER